MWRWAFFILILSGSAAGAHVSEQGFVLLLPTGWYAAGGAATVALTVVIMGLVPASGMARLFASRRIGRWPLAGIAQTGALVVLCALLVDGYLGATDPLRNAWPLAFWVVFWIAMVAVQGVVFDIWRFVNPFAALARMIPHLGRGRRPSIAWALALFLLFTAFMLADIAPSDPRRLSHFAVAYVAATVLGLLWYGRRWLVRGEVFTVLMRCVGGVAVMSGGRLGAWGWRIVRRPEPSLLMAVFMILLLGSGSFDGLNETFWWLQQIGVNPLAFPGRSAVVVPTIVGLLAANLALILAYGLTVGAGARLAGGPFWQSFRVLAPSMLPIAVGYHVAHYLTSFLVDVQYVKALVLDYVGMEPAPVTTGFFNTLATVRVIWLAQAGAVVLGHVSAVLVAHALALRLYRGDHRAAALSQVPLAAFMVAYTLFGLWLLASPRGA